MSSLQVISAPFLKVYNLQILSGLSTLSFRFTVTVAGQGVGFDINYRLWNGCPTRKNKVDDVTSNTSLPTYAVISVSKPGVSDSIGDIGILSGFGERWKRGISNEQIVA